MYRTAAPCHKQGRQDNQENTKVQRIMFKVAITVAQYVGMIIMVIVKQGQAHVVFGLTVSVPRIAGTSRK